MKLIVIIVFSIVSFLVNGGKSIAVECPNGNYLYDIKVLGMNIGKLEIACKIKGSKLLVSIEENIVVSSWFGGTDFKSTRKETWEKGLLIDYKSETWESKCGDDCAFSEYATVEESGYTMHIKAYIKIINGKRWLIRPLRKGSPNNGTCTNELGESFPEDINSREKYECLELSPKHFPTNLWNKELVSQRQVIHAITGKILENPFIQLEQEKCHEGIFNHKKHHGTCFIFQDPHSPEGIQKVWYDQDGEWIKSEIPKVVKLIKLDITLHTIYFRNENNMTGRDNP